MAQADYIISNQTFPNTRADINNHLSAIATNNSGTSAPTTQYAGQFWIDTTTTTWTLYIHDGTDDIQFATIDTSANTVNFTDSALDVVTDTTPQLGGDLDLNSNDITGTGNINITGTATVTGLTTTGDINFGDNDKAVFGAGSDLQIYHDGVNSRIDDTGTGSLIIKGSNFVRVTGQSNGYTLADFVDTTGESKLFHQSNLKLATTSSGIDVTGKGTFSGAGSFEALELITSDANRVYVTGNSSVNGDMWAIGTSTSNPNLNIDVKQASGEMLFRTSGNTERMRIDSSGNVLVGTTSTDPDVQGVRLVDGGASSIVRDGGLPLYVIRNTSDGNIAEFRKDGATVGSIGSISGGVYFNSVSQAFVEGEGTGLNFRGDIVRPSQNNATVDNVVDLGQSSVRFDDIYATNGTIQTSDQNEKQSIQSLTASEIAVAQRISKLFKTFKFNSAVEEKGDNARTHTGIIAQDVQQAFADEGLDAGNYALFISSTWWEKEISVDAVAEELDEEGNVLVEGKDAYTYIDIKEEATEGYTERTRLGIRYPELLSFVSSAFEQRLTDIETRLTALET